MIFALGDPGRIAMVGLLYCTVGIGSVVTLVWSFLRGRRSLLVLIGAAVSALFGAGLSLLFLQDGTTLSEDWADWLFAGVPLICGGIACIRFIFTRDEKQAT